jgi:hypothetical protein
MVDDQLFISSYRHECWCCCVTPAGLSAAAFTSVRTTTRAAAGLSALAAVEEARDLQ